MKELLLSVAAITTIVGGINLVTISATSSDNLEPNVVTFLEWPCNNLDTNDIEYCWLNLITGEEGP